MTGIGDDKFMRRCLDLAIRAEGMTYPNPVVGAVIVHNGIIVGEGYHLKAGKPHAEVIAIDSVSDKALLHNSTLYISLEPCSHFGKTPPCTDYILSHGIPKVVAGTIDTSSKVSGNGIKILAKAGCEVITGVLEDDCRKINRRFFTFHEMKRPFITLKWAQSPDGYIDIRRSGETIGRPNWISGKPERVLVHKWRASVQAILAGAETIRIDNPKLNVREWSGSNPVRLILSRSGNLNNYLTENETNGTVIVFTSDRESNFGKAEKVLLDESIPATSQIVDYLYKKGIQSLLIEGGAEVLNQFIGSGLWDEAKIFHGKYDFMDGVKAPSIKGKLISEMDFLTSRLVVLLNEESITG
jgi:diaminohydroxyphosphoribosylaminopyrimidine deaminase/5-amino-6-(5-phosphoribosylamino)uracil reductase